jgi:hypothetical protein
MPFAMASSRRLQFPEPPGKQESFPTRGYATRPVVADFRPFVRKSEIWIKKFTTRGGRLTNAMLYYQ